LVRGVLAGLERGADADVAEPHAQQQSEEAIERFHGATVILADGVDFDPYLKALLTPVENVRIAQRVAVITDTDSPGPEVSRAGWPI
jgi:putative ATP-dependent endonuclease of OLD family